MPVQRAKEPLQNAGSVAARQGGVIGIYKDLEGDEQLTYQSQTPSPVIFVKEAQIKKVIGRERKEMPISMSKSLFYVTTKRLVFLKLFEISTSELGEDNNMLSSVSGTFYEIPISAITSVDMRPLSLNSTDSATFENILGGDVSKLDQPTLEVIYDEKSATGRAKDYVEAMMGRSLVSKIFGRVEMVYDKLFVLGEQSVAIMPQLQEAIRNKS